MSSVPSDRSIHVSQILQAVAEARSEDVTDLPPIGKLLDPEALVEFVESTTVPSAISLEIYDCQVQITGDGDVTATRRDDVV